VPPSEDRIGRAEAEAAAKQERAESPPPLTLLQIVAAVEEGKANPDALVAGTSMTLAEFAEQIEAEGELTASERWEQSGGDMSARVRDRAERRAALGLPHQDCATVRYAPCLYVSDAGARRAAGRWP
jgi:hypothetical protein